MKFSSPFAAAAFVATSSDSSSSRRSSNSITQTNLFPAVSIPHHFDVPATTATVTTASSSRSPHYNKPLEEHVLGASSTSSSLTTNIREWLVPSAFAASLPSEQDVELLQKSMAAFYGKDITGKDRDLTQAQDLLTKSIAAWKNQPADEQAALYRVRGDCYMALLKSQQAIQDYTSAIEFLEKPEGDLADPGELPAAYLGRARAIRSLKSDATQKQKETCAQDYQQALQLLSREDWDTNQEKIEDGASRNPYAAWEWGQSLRGIQSYKQASEAHALASFAFGEIGDRAHSVMASMDTGIDLAALSNIESKDLLEKSIQKTTSVEGRDVDLLQRVIAKEGEGRVALASVLWDSGNKAAAEQQLGTACVRLDQLEADAMERAAASSKKSEAVENKLKFSIDDGPGPFETSCSRFKNEKFLTDALEWPAPLQEKVKKLENLN